MKILIVDDSKAMQNIITKSMKGLGYLNDTYDYACDGEEALAKVKATPPDLILSDLHMPKMSGLQMLEALHLDNIQTPIVVVSIDDNPKIMEQVMKAGAFAFLNKPYTSEALYSIILKLRGSNLVTNPKKNSNAAAYLPAPEVLERVVSSLASTKILWQKSTLAEVNYHNSPFFGCTYSDHQNKLAFSVFMDVIAANLVAAILGDNNMEAAQQKASKKVIEDDSRHQLIRFFKLLTSVCKTGESNKLLEVHSDVYAENANTHLKGRLMEYADTTIVYTIGCGSGPTGKILFV